MDFIWEKEPCIYFKCRKKKKVTSELFIIVETGDCVRLGQVLTVLLVTNFRNANKAHFEYYIQP